MTAMIKKKPNQYKMNDGMFDLEDAISATDFTGLIPSAPQNDYAIASYNAVMDYLPSAVEESQKMKKQSK